MPYLADTKIAVEFNSIVVNTDYQLISGVVETSYNPDWKNVVDVKEVVNDFNRLMNDIAALFDKANELENQKSLGIISEEAYNKNWKEIYSQLENANEQYKALVNTDDIPEELKKKVTDLNPVFVELASNDYTTFGNQTKDNLAKTNDVFQEITKYISNNCNDLSDSKIVLEDISEYKIYSTPTGDAIILQRATNLDFESVYPNETYPDLKVPKGSLVAFTVEQGSFRASYQKEAGKWQFVGYFTNGKKEYLDIDTNNLKDYFADKIEKEGVNSANCPLVFGALAEQGLLTRTLLSLGIEESAIAAGTFLRAAGTTAVLGYLLIKLFGSGTAVTYHRGTVLDLPDTVIPISLGGKADNYVKDIPLDLPITIPHDIPKENTGGDCKVYVIWKLTTQGKVEVAKYGMTCTDDYDENCNMRPEKQCIKFEKENNLQKDKFFYNWVITGITKDMCHIVEKSLTAGYIITHRGAMPSHHYLPCFVRDKQWDEDLEGKSVESERNSRALKWIKDIINQYGAK